MNAIATQLLIDPMEAHDHLSQAREVLQWLEAVCIATSEAIEAGDTVRAKHLASVSHYLAQDWSNYFDCQIESFVNMHSGE